MAYQFTNVARECKAFGKASTRLVLMVLASCADKDGICYPSYACLIHWAKVSRSTLAEALKELEESGVLHRGNRYRRSNVYTLMTAKLEELRESFRRPVFSSDQSDPEPSLDYHEICELVNALSGNTERGAEGRTHLEDVGRFVEMQEESAKAVAVLRWFLELNQKGDSHTDLDFSPGVKDIKKWEQLVEHYSELAEHYDRAHPGSQAVTALPWENRNSCEKSQHEWHDYTHAVQQCAVCGTFRCNPIVLEWTGADDAEAEYNEIVEFCVPCEPYFTGTGSANAL